MDAVRKYCDADVRVVAPIPYYPDISIGKNWNKYVKIPKIEKINELKIYHPRYIVTPKVGMTLYGLFMFLGTYKTVKKIMKNWPFDVIDAHYVYPDGFAAILLGKILKKPVIISARGTDINHYPSLMLIRSLIKWVICESKNIISVCQSLADVMILLGASKNKVAVIPNGIDPSIFHNIDYKKARQKLKLPVDQKILLSVGSLIERKGFHLLITAINKIKINNSLNFKFYIIGEGKNERKLNNMIKKYELYDDVCLIGSIPNRDLNLWYNAANLFILGSSREGWPNVVNEALACGTPVVATNVDGIPDIITSDKLGIVVERDVDQFVSSITLAFEKEWDYDYIYRIGQKRTWENVAREVYSTFSSLKNE